jgi:hypothetical protein
MRVLIACNNLSELVCLSFSCIPLYNFKYVYDYVMSSQKSFVDRYSH